MMILWLFSLGRPRRSRDIQEIIDDGRGGSRWALCHLFFPFHVGWKWCCGFIMQCGGAGNRCWGFRKVFR